MAAGFGAVRRQAMLDWLAGHAATAPGAFSVGLWVADPGEDGQSGAEVTGTNYTRGSITNNTGWSAATNATPAVLANSGTITFNSGTVSGWTTGITHVAIWTAAGTTAANFVGRANITGAPVTVGNGTTSVTIAAAALTMSMTST